MGNIRVIENFRNSTEEERKLHFNKKLASIIEVENNLVEVYSKSKFSMVDSDERVDYASKERRHMV